MPGTIWMVQCGACAQAWEVHPGALPRSSLLPAICPTCREIVTAESHDEHRWHCPECRTPLTPLPGAELLPGEELPEQLEGVPCPSCSSEALRAGSVGLWD